MKITVEQNENTKIKFQGKINMSQEIILNKNNAKKLGQILLDEKSEEFETE